MPHLLSKTRFVAGCQCHDFLWRKVHEPDAPEFATDLVLEDRLEQGTRVGELARTRFPGGLLFDLPHTAREERVRRTRRALGTNVPAIFEASFVEDGVFVAVDVLERVNGGYNLIEVKSTKHVKPEHYVDVAIQTHVLRKAGIDVRRVELMHLNSECRYPDLSNLFVRQDLTAQVEDILPGIPGEIEAQLQMLDGPFPDKGFGEQCQNAPHCPFPGRCYPDMTGDHVHALYGVGMKKRWDLIVVEDTLAEALEQLRPPLAFLDIETVQHSIPHWVACTPDEQVPAQFSCYFDDGSSELVHHEWLAEGPGDPREPLALKLIDALRNARLVVTYDVRFEKECVQSLSAALPHLAAELHAIEAKLVDLEPVVRNHVYHPEFAGNFSLKRVLHVLVPELYQNKLDVSKGVTASVNISHLMLKPDRFSDRGRKMLRRQLLEYNEHDTWAKVRLVERLRELAE